jgi:hypothetical protein
MLMLTDMMLWPDFAIHFGTTGNIFLPRVFLGFSIEDRLFCAL